MIDCRLFLTGIIFSFLFSSCLENGGQIIEYYGDGTVKIKRSDCEKLQCYFVYSKTGSLTQEYRRDPTTDLLEGRAVWYHPNGKAKTDIEYSSGRRHGKMNKYTESGQVEELVFYFEDSLIYKREYAQGKVTNEAIFPLYEIQRDSESVEVNIKLPISEVINEERNLTYCYALMPKTASVDSFILKNGCKSSITLDLMVSNTIKIPIRSNQFSVLGFVFDEKEKHIFDPQVFPTF